MKINNFTIGLKIIIVNGKPGVGKTTFEDLCAEIIGKAYCKKRSTVDKVKEIAKMGGWDGVKDAAGRKLLSDLKDIFNEYNNMPTNDILNYLRCWENELVYYGVGSHPHILFVDDREPKHIDELKKELNAITLLIRRQGDEEVETSNHADEEVFQYEYDWVISNNGSIDDLKDSAQAFLNWIFS